MITSGNSAASDRSHDAPHVQLQRAITALQSRAEEHWHHAVSHVAAAVSPLQHNLQNVQMTLQRHMQQLLLAVPQHLQNSRHRHTSNLMLASMAMAGLQGRRRPQPICDIALARLDIVRKLEGVPVYVVVNSKDEFVLVASEGDNHHRQLGLFFLSNKDANELLNKVKEQDASLAGDVKVMRVGMDALYELLRNPNPSLENATFRLVPDMNELRNASAILKAANVKSRSFGGVPVFQAENLSVNGDKGTYVPLFFSKGDLDAAVDNAFAQRNAAQIKEYESQADKAEAEADRLREQWAEAASKDRKNLKAAIDKEAKRARTARERIDKIRNAAKPKIEVGSLEEVLMKMEQDRGDDWESVMFVPMGSLSATAAAAAAAAADAAAAAEAAAAEASKASKNKKKK